MSRRPSGSAPLDMTYALGLASKDPSNLDARWLFATFVCREDNESPNQYIRDLIATSSLRFADDSWRLK